MLLLKLAPATPCHSPRRAVQNIGGKSLADAPIYAPRILGSAPTSTWRAPNSAPAAAGPRAGRPRHGQHRAVVYAECTGRQEAFASQQTIKQIVDALNLAWFAASNRSLLAARCFVETVLACYQNGVAVDTIKVHLDAENLQNPRGRLLSEKQQDLMLTWVSLVMLTLQEVGTIQLRGAMIRWSPDTLGLLSYIKSNIRLHQQGTTLRQLQDLQAAANQASTGPPSEFTQTMQQNSRLVLLTLEVLAGLDVETEKPLQPSSVVTSATGYTFPFAPHLFKSSELCDADLLRDGPPVSGAAVGGEEEELARSRQLAACMTKVLVADTEERAAAVKLMVAFMGAVLGAQHSALQFVDLVHEAYQQGVPAHRLMAQLRDEEFAQSGGLLPVDPGAYEGPQDVSAQLFGRWLSIVYMSFALLGVPFPDSTELGWAWAGGAAGGSAEAIGLNEFVAQALQRFSADASGAPLPAQASNLAKRLQEAGEEGQQLAELVTAGSMAKAEVTEDGKVLVGGRERATLMRVPDKELEASSTVFAVMKQLTDLVSLAWLKVQTGAAASRAASNGGAATQNGGGAVGLAGEEA